VSTPGEHLRFPPFRLDARDGSLWRGKRRISLTLTDCAVLSYLAQHAGQLVTHEELLAAVWPETSVTKGVLKVRVRRVRRALRDPAGRPRFIETVHRRGYRFIATVRSQAAAIPRISVRGSRLAAAHLPRPAPNFVGREAELEYLRERLDKTLGGERQVLLVAGEPGIGKSTLVTVFLQRVLPTALAAWVGRGHCIETYGPGEPYMPMLEALGRLCRAPRGKRLKTLLRHHAPSWMAQMPALLTSAELDALQRRIGGTPGERMMRELVEAIDALTAERPLVLWLEDLHWSDSSSLALLSALARRQEPARLLVVGTYRPLEVLGTGHPLDDLRRELRAHGLCDELNLGRLSEADVLAYLTTRFPQAALPSYLAHLLHQRTEGNPLFLVSMVDELLAREQIVEVAGAWALRKDAEALEATVPESIRQLVARQRERLQPGEQRVLEAASVAGPEFAAAAVAAALERPVAEVEEQCASLSGRQQFLRAIGVGEWPDGTVTAQYGFIHAMHQMLWHEQVSVGRRQQWHLQVGSLMEAAHGDRASEIAAELAMHFEHGRDYRRAIRYLRRASANAMRRGAPHEAIMLARRGLDLLDSLTEASERSEQELELRIALGPPLQMTKGIAAPEVQETFSRAQELCRHRGDDPRLASALVGLVRFSCNRVEFGRARELGERLLRIAQSLGDRFRSSAHALLGVVYFNLGELAAAYAHLEEALALHDPQRSESLARLYGDNIEVPCLGYGAVVLWHLGYPERALKKSRAALTAARKLALPHPLAFALALASWLHRLRKESSEAQSHAKELVALAIEHGFPFWVAQGTVELGWALALQGAAGKGLALMQEGADAYRATGAELARVGNLVALAEARWESTAHSIEELDSITEALASVAQTGQRYHEPELYRLKGELLLQYRGNVGTVEAEACFHQAIEVSGRQGAKLLELRAAMSLARLWQRQGKRDGARVLLAEISQWFTEGFDTQDLQDAKSLLRQLTEAI
jgi:DNA-binding winged helix-turn-helix (wHTH) protein/predicted ATPase